MIRVTGSPLGSVNAFTDAPRMGVINAKLSGNRARGRVAIANGLDHFWRQARVPMRHSLRPSPLSRTVPVVIPLGRRHKVVGIHANGVVASMHNNKPIRNCPLKPFVRVSVGADLLLSGQNQNPVAIAIFTSLPNPARVGFFDAAKKNVLRGQDWKFAQSPFTPERHIARSAQLSTDGRALGASSANNGLSRVIGHMGSFKRPFYAITMERAS